MLRVGLCFATTYYYRSTSTSHGSRYGTSVCLFLLLLKDSLTVSFVLTVSLLFFCIGDIAIASWSYDHIIVSNIWQFGSIFHDQVIFS